MNWVSDTEEPGAGAPDVEGGSEGSRQAKSGDLLVLTTVYNPLEAEIILAKLRSAGIQAFARHEALSVVYGLTVDGSGEHAIMVRAEDWEEAQAA
ncbi:MAG: DUF2007 domain-containing protein, partial [Thermoleophilia bacterium]|nr:DUF2007 domain-containing protein [Thermoleophilia bacterium]